jgi:hypothetical protein
MRYWGLDARGGSRSVLVAAGLERIARDQPTGEGSSRYRQPWLGGWIEIHSFCAGFYQEHGPGFLFSRAEKRVYASSPGAIPEPIHHRRHTAPTSPDAIFPALPPFLTWLLDYEARVANLAPHGYREQCWKRLGGEHFGQHPSQLSLWISSLLRSPQTTPRLHKTKRGEPNRSRLFSSQSRMTASKCHLGQLEHGG